jgi:hypothetical protein
MSQRGPSAAVTFARHTRAADRFKRSRLSNLLTLWLMLALAAQGVIAQAHVHFRFSRPPSAAGLAAAIATAPNDNGSPDQDSPGGPSNCALCQVLASGAAPLGHSFDLALALASRNRDSVRPVSEPTTVSAVSHIWTSRGPPPI